MFKLRHLLALLVFLLPSLALADGLIVIHNPPVTIPGHFSFAPLEVRYHRVSVTIDSNVAITSVDQEFYNPNPQNLEGTYLFPLPDGATIDRFSMDINGKPMEAELLDAAKARQIYEDIVRKQRDPALLEYVGRGAFKVRIFPIEGHAQKRVKLQYTQLLKSDSGLTEYVYPLNTEKFSSRPLNDVSVKVELKTNTAIKNVYCPSHNVDIRRDGNQRAVIGYEERNARPDTDFKVIWSQDKDPVGISLLTWQTGSKDGYFLLMASPGVDVDQKRVQPKDICFVLDTSGSMAGPKMEQAKKALRFCLANLNDNDRFEIVRFSTEAEGFFNEFGDANKGNIDKAQSFVSGLKPIGGTAIQDALKQAVAMKPREGAPFVIIFLTDGQPTIGETNVDKLVDSIKSASPRIFSFGIGTDINTHLLDRIATETKAFSQYVLPEEDIEVKVSSFYTKIKEPVLTGVKLDVTGDVKISQVYPKAMPDLFKGDMLTIFGRYSGNGPAAVKIAGTMNGRQQTFAQDVTFAREDVKHAFIPRLWATRRVGWLLDEIRMHGESRELKDEIVQLAREHGIVTPYTSYLILEDEARRNVPVTLRTMKELESDVLANARVREYYGSARKDSAQLEVAGHRAVENALAANSLKLGDNEQQAAQSFGMAKAPPAGAPSTQPITGYKFAQNYARQTRLVNGRAFYQNGKTWTDAGAQSKQSLRQRQVKFNSEEYFALLHRSPEIAAWLSLGDEVDVVVDDELVMIR